MRSELVFWLGLGIAVTAFFGASLFWELKEYDGTLLDTIGLTFTIIFLALSLAGLIFLAFPNSEAEVARRSYTCWRARKA